MIALTQPSCHNRLKSLNSFSVSLLDDEAEYTVHVSASCGHRPIRYGRSYKRIGEVGINPCPTMIGHHAGIPAIDVAGGKG